MSITLGFIGCGNMAGAIMQGILEAGAVPPEEMIASSLHGTAQKRKDEWGTLLGKDNTEVAQRARFIFLGVKPQYYAEVIAEIAPVVTEDKVVISIAPGHSLEGLEQLFGKPVKLIRTMPNTPAVVGAAMTGFCANERVSAAEKESVLGYFRCFGRVEELPERLMDVVSGVSGSSTAFVCMYVEALADAGVAEGMPRPQAYIFAQQAVYGIAKQMLETGVHPGALKDSICSPAGSTIEGVGVLEDKGFRGAVFEASRACVAKARKLG